MVVDSCTKGSSEQAPVKSVPDLSNVRLLTPAIVVDRLFWNYGSETNHFEHLQATYLCP